MYSRTRNWNWDEEDGERAIPHVTQVRMTDTGLYPLPPPGWWKVYRYTAIPPVDPRTAAIWLYTVATVQIWEREHGRVRQAHMISRDAEGHRVLIVHPELYDQVDDTITAMNNVLVDCTCCGYDCLEHDLQYRVAKHFVRRALRQVDPQALPAILERNDLPPGILDWADLSIPSRIQLVRHERLDPACVLEARHWLDAVRGDSSLFEALATDMHSAGGGAPWWDAAGEVTLIEQPTS